jgi:hypothetical protein
MMSTSYDVWLSHMAECVDTILHLFPQDDAHKFVKDHGPCLVVNMNHDVAILVPLYPAKGDDSLGHIWKYWASTRDSLPDLTLWGLTGIRPPHMAHVDWDLFDRREVVEEQPYLEIIPPMFSKYSMLLCIPTPCSEMYDIVPYDGMYAHRVTVALKEESTEWFEIYENVVHAIIGVPVHASNWNVFCKKYRAKYEMYAGTCLTGKGGHYTVLQQRNGLAITIEGPDIPLAVLDAALEKEPDGTPYGELLNNLASPIYKMEDTWT